jgi:DNA-binding CsgD family transcriptional regulator/PAS domain-containing protein
MATSQNNISTLIGDIYDAALTTDRWPVLLKRLSESLAKAGVSLFVRDLKAEEVPRRSTESMDPELAEGSEAYHLRIKVSGKRRGGAASGGAGDDAGAAGQAFSDAAGEALAPADSIVLGCFVSRDKPVGSLLGIKRLAAKDPGARWDAATLRSLAPHLRRAFELHKQFLSLNAQRSATKRVLDHMPIGVLLVDGRGRVLTTNSSADEIVAQGDGLIIERGGVRGEAGQETAALRALISDAAASGGDNGPDVGGAMTLNRPSMRRPYWILVVPLRGRLADEEGAPGIVALFVSDPERRHEIPTRALEAFFGLTPAEIRLLEALVNGKSLEEASEEFRVSKNTLRTQLHQIFRKTDTSRQSEVIKLVLTAPVQIGSAQSEAQQ